ncbi:MAG: hypothetical protein DHS20C11_28630 [Lysobacteraceae bacterium]|nr:MAG: hypothetical protein DHS20C11_28630 [Xanthomonadaceae bacterium]
MPKYKALLKGEGFPVVSETGETELLGFYATRWVKAENEEQAELAAVQLIKSDESLHELLDARIESNP